MTAATPLSSEVRHEVKELALLFDISQIIVQGRDLKEELRAVLQVIDNHTGMLRGTLALVNPQNGEIYIEAAHGLSEDQRERGRYRPGEGITGLVVQSGRSMILPRISDEPRFLDRTGARKDLRKEDTSFICVPIKIGSEVAGALSVDRLFSDAVSLQEDYRLLSIIASMIGQAVRIHRDAHEQRQRLTEMSLLFEISQALDRSMDMRDEMGTVLKAIGKYTGMVRGTLTLINRQTGNIFIEAATGLSAKQRERGQYKPGEGIIGRVVETGRPMIIPRVSKEPRFLNRTGARSDLNKDDISFICVPIKIGAETIGTLSVDRLFSNNTELDEDVRLLSIIVSMIAQAVRLRQEAAEERRKLIDENKRLQKELRERFRPANIVGSSHEMQEVFDLIAQVAKSDATVLLRGESGVGKELVAHAIHYNSHRAERPFIKVNCAALPENVIESELFGHEKGAFTGAVAQRKGRFELAHGGTIFLDEIGDLSPTMQIRLLRVLQEREFERVGGTDTIKVDVRVIAATNRNLEHLMEDEAFRQDLYYRLNVFPIHIPPLRERRTDILELANYFVEKYSVQSHKDVRRVSTPAIDMLMSYHWPGNVRELENCIERAVLLTTDDVVHGHHLPPTLQTSRASNTVMRGTLDDTVESVEREMIMEALKDARGNMAKAAEALGVTERVMGLRVKKFGIVPKHFKTARVQ